MKILGGKDTSEMSEAEYHEWRTEMCSRAAQMQLLAQERGNHCVPVAIAKAMYRLGLDVPEPEALLSGIRQRMTHPDSLDYGGVKQEDVLPLLFGMNDREELPVEGLVVQSTEILDSLESRHPDFEIPGYTIAEDYQPHPSTVGIAVFGTTGDGLVNGHAECFSPHPEDQLRMNFLQEKIGAPLIYIVELGEQGLYTEEIEP